MEIIIKAKNMSLSPVLRTFIEERIGGLEKFLEDILKRVDTLDGQRARAEAFVEVGKPSRHHRKGDVFYVECQIHLPHKSVRAEAEREYLKSAICEVKDELQKQLKGYKDKQIAKSDRARRRVKQDLKLVEGAKFYRKGRIREEGM